MRDFANLHQLNILSYLESFNSILIGEKMTQSKRMDKLSEIARQQLQVLTEVNKRLLSKGK